MKHILQNIKGLVCVIALLALTNVAMAQQALEVGSNAPTFSGKNQNGDILISKEIVGEKQLLVVFYRGNWCGYCNRHLAELEENFEQLKAAGVEVAVISPEIPEKIAETAKNTDAHFSLVYDEGGRIMKAFNVGFDINETNVTKYFDVVQKKQAEYHPDVNQLPVPATYLIGTDGKIKFAHFDPDYSKRSELSAIIEAAKL